MDDRVFKKSAPKINLTSKTRQLTFNLLVMFFVFKYLKKTKKKTNTTKRQKNIIFLH